jgi:hypothetical protein
MTHLVEDAKRQIGFRTPAACVWLRQKFKYNFDHPDSQALLGGDFRVWGLEKLPLYLQFSGHSNVMLLYDDSKVGEGRTESPAGHTDRSIRRSAGKEAATRFRQVKDEFIHMHGVAGRSISALPVWLQVALCFH